MKEQTLKLSYYHSFISMGTDSPALLSEKLVKMAPGKMSKVFFGNSGSDANDTQVKLVWYYNNVRGQPQKKKIIARKRGYHGVTVMAASLTGFDGMHKGFDLPLPMVRHVKPPHRLWEAEPGMSDADFVQAARRRSRKDDPRRRAGNGRGFHRRAGARGRGRHRSAQGLFPSDPAGIEEARRVVDRR